MSCGLESHVNKFENFNRKQSNCVSSTPSSKSGNVFLLNINSLPHTNEKNVQLNNRESTGCIATGIKNESFFNAAFDALTMSIAADYKS